MKGRFPARKLNPTLARRVQVRPLPLSKTRPRNGKIIKESWTPAATPSMSALGTSLQPCPEFQHRGLHPQRLAGRFGTLESGFAKRTT